MLSNFVQASDPNHRLCAETFGSRCVRNMTELESRFRQEVGNFDVFAQLDAPYSCFFPQVDLLPRLVVRLPNACFVLTHRPVSAWLNSVRHFAPSRKQLLPALLRFCPLSPRNESGLALFYSMQLERARAVLSGHTCALEIDIEAHDAGTKLAAFFNGTNSSCWEHINMGKYHSAEAEEAVA
eukprot:CAMPEP_0181234334 /NCGR_PEP_ID=MMETSP1096-20121128/36895_1 /TAXON_ID=156174 ORGANISM="Chrysochromulina ericina, Strain CCMP281" /NCGR_SAMPLE_ID=MMETSP1096 /ASSEMBLY_ACC=CAM_ASM_000453 /LENGTH=181 /DNA_ID=CAMNT_0023329057 /DNA_START=215 /DNA_END=760 /DNA_ORIENTATION=+